jgi:hypothetical protein
MFLVVFEMVSGLCFVWFGHHKQKYKTEHKTGQTSGAEGGASRLSIIKRAEEGRGIRALCDTES